MSTSAIRVIPYNLPDLELFESFQNGISVLVWAPECMIVVLGQSNNANTSVKVEEVIADKVTVMKRPSGGETVLLSPGTLVLAAVFVEPELKNPKIYFKQINDALISAFDQHGIKNVEQKGISDLTISGRKILGSSIYRSKGKVWYHAVLNVSESPETISKYLSHPSKEPDYRNGRMHNDFITSLEAEGCNLPAEGFIVPAIKKALKDV